MKKVLTVLLTIMIVMTMGACAPKAEEEKAVGAWEEVTDGTITPELQEIFDKAMEGFTGVGYTPVKLLETQLVSGTNYRFLCDSQVVVPDGKKGQAIVTVYKDLEGNVKILDIEEVEAETDGE
ncbi:MAG: hypothetical protein IKF68_07220 [Erysipelotrichaceae bacterium]|nr:hypothetical protein [Erysipelotrichaceae bacterium]